MNKLFADHIGDQSIRLERQHFLGTQFLDIGDIGQKMAEETLLGQVEVLIGVEQQASGGSFEGSSPGTQIIDSGTLSMKKFWDFAHFFKESPGRNE